MAWPSLDSTDSIVKFAGEILEVANLGFQKRLPRRSVLVARHAQNAAVAVDTRRPRPRVLAGIQYGHWGPSVMWSDDLGGTWEETEHGGIRFPEDTGAALADSAVKIEGLEHPVGPTSTSVTIAIAHAIVSTTAEKLVQQGITPGVMVSPNTTSKEAANIQNDANYEALWARLKAR